ncbi:MAG TPA: ECF RNA polymerase sigma factor SigK [Aeromicrobium sp.]|nr:ECF RNA polymerase sigma factor SigK [Aeromicrobium sp.]HKY57761.1 ECF RNA polymerase sigma factor SigK [Aeromicrobium sp.]
MDEGRSIRPAGSPSDGGGPAGSDLAELLRAGARGDENSFARFYDLTSARAWGLALRVLRNPAHAEEVMQEAYLKAWRQASRFDPNRGSAIGWLLTIVHRAAVDRVRSAEAATRRDQNFHESVQTMSEPDETARVVEAGLDAHRVRSAVATLTPMQREAIELAFFGGYTHTEVAGMLEIPLGTAKTRIRDGLIRLRDALGVER